MDHVSNPYNPSKPRPKHRSVPYPASPRIPESPLKPTSSLRHRRQSSIVMSAGLTMSPGSDSESQESADAEASRSSEEAMMDEANTDDEELGRISQAMTLLSLHPTNANGVIPSGHTSTSSASLAPWPSPEELLKESLRQSLSALHALGRIKSLVENLSGNEEEGEEKEGGIAQIMGFYDRAVGEMRAAGEVLTWAQHHLSEEKEAVRERLLKG